MVHTISAHRNSTRGDGSSLSSDKVGAGFGNLLQNRLNQKVTNICCPNSSFVDLVKMISRGIYDEYSTIVIMVGNHSNISRNDLNKSVETLLDLHSRMKCKFILCNFPYACNLTELQNKSAHRMNIHLFNLTCHHSDAILYFDMNNFIHNFTLTRDTLYLSNKYRKLVATLLAYNICDAAIVGLTKFNLTSAYVKSNMTCTPIGNSPVNYTLHATLESVPSNLN